MGHVRTFVRSLAMCVPLVSIAVPARAQGAPTDGGTMLSVLILIGGLLMLVALAVKLYDLKRKRDAEAVQLQAQVSDALLRDETLFGVPVTPTAHVPLWRGTPATLELVGRVPTVERKEAAVRVAEREASAVRPDVHVVDHLTVDGASRAA
jgi:hypothetical protein